MITIVLLLSAGSTMMYVSLLDLGRPIAFVWCLMEFGFRKDYLSADVICLFWWKSIDDWFYSADKLLLWNLSSSHCEVRTFDMEYFDKETLRKNTQKARNLILLDFIIIFDWEGSRNVGILRMNMQKIRNL